MFWGEMSMRIANNFSHEIFQQNCDFLLVSSTILSFFGIRVELMELHNWKTIETTERKFEVIFFQHVVRFYTEND